MCFAFSFISCNVVTSKLQRLFDRDNCHLGRAPFHTPLVTTHSRATWLQHVTGETLQPHEQYGLLTTSKQLHRTRAPKRQCKPRG